MNKHGLKVTIDYVKIAQWLEIIDYHGHPDVRKKYIAKIKNHLDEAVIEQGKDEL